MMSIEAATSTRSRAARQRRTRVLFVVSRDRPDRYESLVRAFSSDADVKVIFDRRRLDRRQLNGTPIPDRRRWARRSDWRVWTLRSKGWIRIEY